jgi:hypothetical protein
MKRYILNGREPKEATLAEWAADQFDCESRRTVARDDIDGVRVSTVFLGLDHSFNGGPPLLFETMIFGGPHDQWQERCSTWEEAEEMHKRAVAIVNDTTTKVVIRELERDLAAMRVRLLTAAGDDLCRLTQEEIKAYTSGAVKIPPESEFLASCKRFHVQVANESGVMSDCLTLAQLVAENERLIVELAEQRRLNAELIHADTSKTHCEELPCQLPPK